MGGLPVTIRLLDPPLHEFLPNWKEYKELVAEKSRLEALGTDPDEQRRIGALIEAVEKLREANPMLGHRGCRLGITHPEIYGMQVRAIMEAACTAAEQGVRVEPEIMIPLTGTVGEMKETFEQTRRVADGVIAEMGVPVRYLVGTMIEVPRAALIAQKMAEYAEFFSFGTNDLDPAHVRLQPGRRARSSCREYLDMGLPAAGSVLDPGPGGRGRADRARHRPGPSAPPRPQGRDLRRARWRGPRRWSFCHKVGMNYVSCSPFLIPGARLAAAQARIKERLAGGGDHR